MITTTTFMHEVELERFIMHCLTEDAPNWMQQTIGQKSIIVGKHKSARTRARIAQFLTKLSEEEK